jgi:hypothetical protein
MILIRNRSLLRRRRLSGHGERGGGQNTSKASAPEAWWKHEHVLSVGAAVFESTSNRDSREGGACRPYFAIVQGVGGGMVQRRDDLE